MDDSLEIKKLDRKLVELLVAKELNKLAEEAALSAIESFGTKKNVQIPDVEKWARRIIAIVKEHSH
jgi:hypothetical protein